MAFKGELLKAWRTEHEMSQAAAAGQINITQGMWAMLERGNAEPSTDTLVSISQLTGISIDDLLGNPTTAPPRRRRGGSPTEAA